MRKEDAIQQEMFMWHWNSHPEQRGLLFHVPNENQHKKTNIGVVSGVSDLIFLHNEKVFFIEVKTPTGKQSPKQKKWEDKVKKAGYEYFVVRNLEEFIAIYELILKNY